MTHTTTARRAGLVAAGSALLVVLAPAAAHAAVHRAPDATGDVDRVRSGHVEGAVGSNRTADITREVVDHSRTTVVITVGVRDLVNQRFGFVEQIEVPGVDGRYVLTGRNTRRDGLDYDLKAPGDGTYDDSGMSVLADFRDGHDRLVFSFPTRTFGRPAWVRVGSELSVPDGGSDLVDVAGPRGLSGDPSGNLPLGPKVRI